MRAFVVEEKNRFLLHVDGRHAPLCLHRQQDEEKEETLRASGFLPLCECYPSTNLIMVMEAPNKLWVKKEDQ